MTILALGDSFTLGAELPDMPLQHTIDQTFANTWYDEQTRRHCLIEPSQLSWPALLGKKLNQDVENWGLLGGSNDRIFRLASTLTKEYSLIICAWTDVSRLDWFNNNKELPVSVNSHALFSRFPAIEHYYKYHYDSNQAIQRCLGQIITLQNNFKFINQKFVFVNSFNQLPADPLVSKIDTRYYIDTNSSMYNWCKHLPIGKDNHPLEFGHELIANKIYQHLLEENIL